MNTVDIFCSRGYRFILPKTLFKPLRRRSRKPDKKKRLSAQILEKPPRNGQWDMGHIVEDINKPNIYAREYDKYLSGEITEDAFLEWYRNAKNYEPQLPRYNRGLKEKK